MNVDQLKDNIIKIKTLCMVNNFLMKQIQNL